MNKEQSIMNITTAINQLQKEADFLGLPFLETLQDIKKYGRMAYSQRTMEAFDVFFNAGQSMFAEV
jgi:hypothetical protein